MKWIGLGIIALAIALSHVDGLAFIVLVPIAFCMADSET